MAFVFISYRREDNLNHLPGERHFAHTVKEYLNNMYGPDFCFMDPELNRGMWRPQLQEEIEKSTVLLVFLSPGCLELREGEDVFRKEIKTAIDLGKEIVAVRYVDFKVPKNDELCNRMEHIVNDNQRVDFNPSNGEEYARKLAEIAYLTAEPAVDSTFRDMRRQAAQGLDFFAKKQFGATAFDSLLLAPVAVENKEGCFEDLYQAVESATSMTPGDPILLTAKGGQGKTTQMIRFGQKLLAAVDKGGREDCLACYFHLYAIDTFKEGEDLIDRMLDAAHVAPSMRKLIKDDIRNGERGHKYFLLLDGLDEIPSDHPVRAKIKALGSPVGQVEYHNLQMIVAGRSDSQNVFGFNNVLNIRLNDLERENVKKWLEDKGKNIDAYAGIIKSPMLLLLACESENPEIRKHITRWMNNNSSPLISKGQVLWNYSEYLLGKLVAEGQPDEVIKAADELIRRVLPFIAYNCCFLNDEMEAIVTDVEIAIGEDDEKLLPILIGHFPGLAWLENNKYTFSHRLFRDYFAMVHVANTYRKLLFGRLKDDDQADYECLFHNKFLEKPEYSDLLVSILPGVLKITTELERSTVEQIRKIQENNRYSEKARQHIRVLGGVYPLWTVKAWSPYYKTLESEGKGAYAGFVRDAFDGFSGVAAMLAEKRNDPACKPLLVAECISFVYCVLSQVYRSGSLLMSSPEITIVSEEKTDLNKSLRYAMEAVKLNECHQELIDGFNYVGKAFNRARENLLNRKRKDQEIILQEDDLLLTDELLKPIVDTLSEETREEIVGATTGSVLTAETAERRIKVLWLLAEYWLNESEKHECVLSMNLLALMDEMAQEEKPEKERNYLRAYEKYEKGSSLKQPASPYSAMKAAQMLAQGKVGLDGKGNACSADHADPEKTVEKAAGLHEIALASGGYWGQIALCRGQLYMRYGIGLDDRRPLTRESMVREAYDSLSFAFEQWTTVILPDIEWLEAGLELAVLCPDMREKIYKDLTDKVQKHFCRIFPGFAASVKKERHADKWTPSVWIFREYCQRIRDIFNRHKDMIMKLSLGGFMDQWLACIEKEEQLLEAWEAMYV